MEKPTTTIVVNSQIDIGFTGNAIKIGEEVLEILPIKSKEGQLLKIVDKKKMKGVLLRVKYRPDMQ